MAFVLLHHRQKARTNLDEMKRLAQASVFNSTRPTRTMTHEQTARAHSFHSKSFKLRYGLLYIGYSPNREWWEVVVAFRKVGVVIIGTFGTLMNSQFLQAFMALLIVFLALIAHLTGNPFDRTTKGGRLLHGLEFCALTLAFLTFWIGMFFCLAHESGAESEIISEGWIQFLSVVLIFGNLLFLGVSVSIFLREALREGRRKKEKRRRTLSLKSQHAQASQNDKMGGAPGGCDSVVEVKPGGVDSSSPSAGDSPPPPPPQQHHHHQQQQQQQQSRVKVMPTNAEAIPAIDSPEHIDAHVSQIMKTASVHEEQLKKLNSHRQKKSKRNTQMRVQARAKIRQHKALEKVAMFSHLDSSAIDMLLKSTKYKRYQSGDIICREGDTADKLFVIVTGTCGVTVATGTGGESLRVATLRELEVFGENSLLVYDADASDASTVRMATVTAEGDAGNAYGGNTVQMLELDREVFHDLMDAGVIDGSVVASVHELGQQHRSDTANTVSANTGDGSDPASKNTSDEGGTGLPVEGAGAAATRAVDSKNTDAAASKPAVATRDTDAGVKPDDTAPTKPDAVAFDGADAKAGGTVQPKVNAPDKAKSDDADLTSNQETKLKGIFSSFDVDGSGHLSVEEFSKMMTRLGSSMDVIAAREIILRDTELEVSFEGFCNIVKAAGARSSKRDDPAASPPQPPPPQPKGGGRASLNSIVLEKYKNNHSSGGGGT